MTPKLLFYVGKTVHLLKRLNIIVISTIGSNIDGGVRYDCDQSASPVLKELAINSQPTHLRGQYPRPVPPILLSILFDADMNPIVRPLHNSTTKRFGYIASSVEGCIGLPRVVLLPLSR